MNCEEARKAFVDYWRGSLDPAGSADLQAHLAGCESCRMESESLTRVWATLGALPEVDPSAQMRIRFYDSLRDLRNRESRGWWFHPAFQVGFGMAVLLIGILVGRVTTVNSGQV